ncbi:MAG TPA: rhodoquinone biosynthesis methyltransferase RquA [Acidiferrobacterales bacterium]
MLSRWHRYLDGHPRYLAEHYWWAYLSPWGVWFFDRQPVVNAILFGQYRRIMAETLRRLCAHRTGRTLQLTGVYGELTAQLAGCVANQELHLMDVAMVQLASARAKLRRDPRHAPQARHLARMNAESLAYADDSFDTIIIYFLLHELPPDARRRALCEALRVLKPGGRLIVAEYGERRARHWLHRAAPLRWLLERAEPFLPGFWSESLNQTLAGCAATQGKDLQPAGESPVFGGFYRVAEYRMRAAAG